MYLLALGQSVRVAGICLALIYAMAVAHAEIPAIRIEKPSVDGAGCFGASVAIAGSRLWVADTCSMRADQWATGVVYQYVRDGAGWTLERTIVSPSASWAGRFGQSLSANAKGGLAIGAPGEPPRGAVYSIVIPNNPVYRVYLPVSSPTDAVWGDAIAYASNGLLIGAPRTACSIGHQCGVVTQGDGLYPPFGAPNPTVNMRFGYSMAADARRVLVGAPGNRTAYLYQVVSVPETITHLATFAATSPSAASFAETLAVSEDWVAIGAPGDALSQRPGMVWVYQRVGDYWYLRRVLSAPDVEARAGFGASLAMTPEGLWVGTTATAESEAGTLHRYQFGADGAVVASGSFHAGYGGSDYGFALVLAARGRTWVVGVPHARKADAYDSSGAVYVSAEDFLFYGRFD